MIKNDKGEAKNNIKIRNCSIVKNNKVFFSILFSILIPNLYVLFQNIIIGNSTTELTNLNITSQWQFISEFFIFISDGFVLTMFFLLKKKNKIHDIFWLTFLLLIFIFAILASLEKTIQFYLIGTNSNDVSKYFLLLFASNIFSITTSLLINYSFYLKKNLLVYILFFIKIISFTLLSIFLYANQQFLKMGIIGLGLTSFITEASLFIITVSYYYKSIFIKKINFWKIFEKRVVIFSVLESIIRNAFYIFIVAKLINTIQYQSGYFLFNTIMWNIALVPILAVGTFYRLEFTKSNIKNLFLESVLVVILMIILFWTTLFLIIYVPLAQFIVKNDIVIKNSLEISKILLGFYVLYAFSCCTGAFLYANGKTFLIMIISLITNILINATGGILFFCNFIAINQNLVFIFFGLGIATEFFLELFFVLRNFSFIKFQKIKDSIH